MIDIAVPLRYCLILDGYSVILCASIDGRRGMVRLSNTTEIRSDLRVRLFLLCASTVRRITMLYPARATEKLFRLKFHFWSIAVVP